MFLENYINPRVIVEIKSELLSRMKVFEIPNTLNAVTY